MPEKKKCARLLTPYECGHETVDFKFCGGDHPDEYGYRAACYRTAGLPLATSQKLPTTPGGCIRDCMAKLCGWNCCQCDKKLVPARSGLTHSECEHDICENCDLGMATLSGLVATGVALLAFGQLLTFTEPLEAEEASPPVWRLRSLPRPSRAARRPRKRS